MIPDEVNYILKSEIRLYILISLKKEAKTPTELIQNEKYHISHISSNLKDLQEKNYVKLINPKVRKNKLFTLTKEGKEILKKISKLTKI